MLKTEERKKLRIAVFQHTNLRIGAGEERAILNYSKNLQHRDFGVTIYQTDYCPNANLSSEEIKVSLGNIELLTLNSPFTRFRFEEFDTSQHNRISRLLSKMFFLSIKVLFLPLYNLVANHELLRKMSGYDLIYMYDAEFVGFIPWFTRKKKLVGVLRRDFNSIFPPRNVYQNFSYSLTYIIYSWMVRNFTAFHFLSSRLSQNSPIHRRGDFILNSGTDISNFKPEPNLRNGKFKFLFVGRLEEIKGLTLSVESFEELNDSNCEFHIVGTGNLSEYAKRKAKESTNIFYDGFLTQEKLAYKFKESDVLVFPTLMNEQHPLVVVEAIASGLKVITTKTLQGIFDNFERLGHLYYLDAKKEVIAKKMSELLLEKDNIRNQASEISLSAERYSWEVITEQLFTKLIQLASN